MKSLQNDMTGEFDIEHARPVIQDGRVLYEMCLKCTFLMSRNGVFPRVCMKLALHVLTF